MGFAADAPGAGLVRRRQARDLRPLGPLLGAGVGAAGARHSAAARQGRTAPDAAREPVRRVVPQHHADQGQSHRPAPRARCTARTTPTTISCAPSTTLRPAPTSTPWPTCAAPPARATWCSPPSTTTASPCGPRPWRIPVKGAYRARRDLVGDLSEAVRARRMRMGLYYSGGYDWPYNDAVMTHAADAVLAAPHGTRYVDYVTAHVRELIDALRAVRAVERHRVAEPTRGCRSSSPTTTTRWRRASSTTAGGSRACRATG